MSSDKTLDAPLLRPIVLARGFLPHAKPHEVFNPHLKDPILSQAIKRLEEQNSHRGSLLELVLLLTNFSLGFLNSDIVVINYYIITP
jgi:hypothetical protein